MKIQRSLKRAKTYKNEEKYFYYQFWHPLTEHKSLRSKQLQQLLKMTSTIIKTKLGLFQIGKGSKSKNKIIREYTLSILEKSFHKFR